MQERKGEIPSTRVVVDCPYANAIWDGKWQSRNLCSIEVKSIISKVEVLDKISTQEGDLLSRCLVGFCNEKPKERTTLADIRRWWSTNWKKAFGKSTFANWMMRSFCLSSQTETSQNKPSRVWGRWSPGDKLCAWDKAPGPDGFPSWWSYFQTYFPCAPNWMKQWLRYGLLMDGILGSEGI